MNDEEIARLRALCEKATPGPWKQSWTWTGKHSMPMSIETHDEKRVIGTLDEYEDQSGADSAFIAESRTALPRALDEIERLRNVGPQIKEAIDQVARGMAAVAQPRVVLGDAHRSARGSEVNDVIYTVETGEYSDHSIHGFCTTLEEASRVAQQWLDSRGYVDDDEPRPSDCYSWPFVYENPTNTLVGYAKQAKRVKWCAADNFEQPEVPK